jgi:hypothetical protein
LRANEVSDLIGDVTDTDVLPVVEARDDAAPG